LKKNLVLSVVVQKKVKSAFWTALTENDVFRKILFW